MKLQPGSYDYDNLYFTIYCNLKQVAAKLVTVHLPRFQNCISIISCRLSSASVVYQSSIYQSLYKYIRLELVVVLGGNVKCC